MKRDIGICCRHTDHLRGLDDSAFARFMIDHPSIRIYCSEASRYFLSKLSAYQHLTKYYSVVRIDQPFIIQNPLDSSKDPFSKNYQYLYFVLRSLNHSHLFWFWSLSWFVNVTLRRFSWYCFIYR